MKRRRCEASINGGTKLEQVRASESHFMTHPALDKDDDVFEVVDFTLTLYFDAKPAMSAAALMEAWGREGDECRVAETEGVFSGFRGFSYVIVATPEPVGAIQLPEAHPGVALADVAWGKTYSVDAKAALGDIRRATYQARCRIRLRIREDLPHVAHNDIATTLLGIHQVASMCAVTFDYLQLIVGQRDLDDFLNYKNTSLDQAEQYASMLAFGAFVTQNGPCVRAWTTGLPHFGQTDLLVEQAPGEQPLSPHEALMVVFNLGRLVCHKRRFKSGEALTSVDLSAQFDATQWNGRPALRVIASRAIL